MGPMDAGAGVFTEIAFGASTLADYERASLEVLDRAIGFDVAFFARADGPGPVRRGLDASVLAECAARWSELQGGMEPFWTDASARGGAGIDSEFFSRRALERLPYHDAIMRPHGGTSTLMGRLQSGARMIGSVILGRCGGHFTEAERRALSAMRRALSVCELAMGERQRSRRSGSALATLTAREREVAGFLGLGYTNEQIAKALGSAPRTVRNQLSQVYAKLGVGSRAEALAVLLGH